MIKRIVENQSNMITRRPQIVMEIESDPVVLAQAEARHKQFMRNSAWLQAHTSEVYSQHRGKCICIASEQLFVADTAKEVLALATAAHPDDKGRFVHYIPKKKVVRI